MCKRNIIYEFLDSKYSSRLSIEPIIISDGMPSIVFMITQDKKEVVRYIHYLETKKTHLKANLNLIYELIDWFGVTYHEGDKIVGEWFETNGSKLLNKNTL